MSIVIKVITFPVRKLINISKSFNTFLMAPTTIKDRCSNLFTYSSKVVGVTAGGCGMAKGSVDALEAIACQDGVCFVVSCIGICADTLHMSASFVPGPNVTAIVTIPISSSCKFFVYLCKSAQLPWKRMC